MDSKKNVFQLNPLIVEWIHQTRYLVSAAEYTPFFTALANRKFLVTRCIACPYWGRDYTYATPRPGLACMYCGRTCEWVEITPMGRIHSFTYCEYAGEMYKHLVPFALVMVEFDGVDTLFMSQLKDADMRQPLGATPEELEAWMRSFIGKPVRARYKKLIEPKSFDVTDIWFVPDNWSKE